MEVIIDTSIAIYFSIIAALLVAGGVMYQARNWEAVEKAPKEITPSHGHHH